MTFEAGPLNPLPIAMDFNHSPRDATAILPSGAQAKLTALRQRARDLHASIPAFDTIREFAEAAHRHRARIKDLMKPRAEGGFGLDETSPQVVDERRKMERATAERDRLNQLSEVRSAKWNSAARLARDVDDWLLRGGVPQNCVLESAEDTPAAELLRKNERIGDAVARLRHRLRELAADVHRCRSQPYPSSVAKQRAAEQIASMARAPDCSRAIEFGLEVMFPASQTLTMARGAPRSGTEPLSVAIEAPDTQGLMFWLFQREITARVHAEIDACSDDAHAMTEEQRAEQQAEIAAAALQIERQECALIWAAEAAGDILDFREQTSPLALLGCRLATVAPQVSSGTSMEHAFDVIGR